MPIVQNMGWLWNEIHDMFDEDDGSFPEICICSLSPEEVIAGYHLIRQNSAFIVGGPRVFVLDTNTEMELDKVNDPAGLVCRKKAQPFHFMVRNIKFAAGQLHELGVFILDNAIAIDYEKGPMWGELQIETLLMLINQIKKSSSKAFVRLEDSVEAKDRQRMEKCLDRLKLESNTPEPA